MTDVADLSGRKILAGPRLKRLRRERGLTQARMAEELAVSASYLNLMERNQRPITLPVLARLTDVYGSTRASSWRIAPGLPSRASSRCWPTRCFATRRSPVPS